MKKIIKKERINNNTLLYIQPIKHFEVKEGYVDSVSRVVQTNNISTSTAKSSSQSESSYKSENKSYSQLRKIQKEKIEAELEQYKHEQTLHFQQELEVLKAQALEAAKEEGRQQGYAQYIETCNALVQAINDVVSIRNKSLYHFEPFLIDLSAAISSRILEHQVALNPALFRRMFIEALNNITDKEKITIQINPADSAELDTIQHQFSKKFKEFKHVEIKEVATMQQGGCTIETKLGYIDGSMETKVAILRDAMKSIYAEEKERLGDEAVLIPTVEDVGHIDAPEPIYTEEFSDNSDQDNSTESVLDFVEEPVIMPIEDNEPQEERVYNDAIDLALSNDTENNWFESNIDEAEKSNEIFSVEEPVIMPIEGNEPQEERADNDTVDIASTNETQDNWFENNIDEAEQSDEIFSVEEPSIAPIEDNEPQEERVYNDAIDLALSSDTENNWFESNIDEAEKSNEIFSVEEPSIAPIEDKEPQEERADNDAVDLALTNDTQDNWFEKNIDEAEQSDEIFSVEVPSIAPMEKEPLFYEGNVENDVENESEEESDFFQENDTETVDEEQDMQIEKPATELFEVDPVSFQFEQLDKELNMNQDEDNSAANPSFEVASQPDDLAFNLPSDLEGESLEVNNDANSVPESSISIDPESDSGNQSSELTSSFEETNSDFEDLDEDDEDIS
jgi:flagellar biosynthesis/type III secretory pathway protein FliH